MGRLTFRDVQRGKTLVLWDTPYAYTVCYRAPKFCMLTRLREGNIFKGYHSPNTPDSSAGLQRPHFSGTSAYSIPLDLERPNLAVVLYRDILLSRWVILHLSALRQIACFIITYFVVASYTKRLYVYDLHCDSPGTHPYWRSKSNRY